VEAAERRLYPYGAVAQLVVPDSHHPCPDVGLHDDDGPHALQGLTLGEEAAHLCLDGYGGGAEKAYSGALDGVLDGGGVFVNILQTPLAPLV